MKQLRLRFLYGMPEQVSRAALGFMLLEWVPQAFIKGMREQIPLGVRGLIQTCYSGFFLPFCLESTVKDAPEASRVHPCLTILHVPSTLQQLAAVVSEPSRSEVTLKPLLRHLKRMSKSLAYGRQEDTHEFFYSLVNTMESILLAEKGGKQRYDVR